MAGRTARLRTAMQRDFAPLTLEITDESARHAGHAGVREAGPGGETHYAMLVVSEAFTGRTRVQRSRLVHEALAGEFATGLHALSLTLRSPADVGS